MPEETAASPEQQPNPLSYDEVLRQYADLATQQGDTTEKIWELVGDAGIDEHFADGIDEHDIQAQIDALGEAIRTAVGTDREDEIQPLLDALKKTHLDQAALEVEGSPIVRTILQERLLALTEHLDWDKIIEDNLSPPQFDMGRHIPPKIPQPTLDDLLKFAGNKEWHTKQDLPTMLKASEELAAMMPAFADYRLEKPDAATSLETQEMIHGNLEGAIQDWVELTLTVASIYASGARRDLLVRHMPRDDLRRLAMYASQAGFNGQGEGGPAVVAEALERAVAKRMTAFDEFDRQQIAAHAAERPNALMVQGGHLLTESTGITDVQTWINEAFEDWPGWFTNGIGFIEFSPQLDDEPHATKHEPQIVLDGQWVQGHNKLRLNTFTHAYNEFMAKDLKEGRSPDEAMHANHSLLTRYVNDNVVHELMHNAHMNTLSIKWLREWHATATSENAVVSDYVKRIRQKDIDEAYMEDLCDSTSEYRYRPVSLYKIASGRFEQLNNLFNAYEPQVLNYIRDRAATLDKQNPDAVQRAYDNVSAKRFLRPTHEPSRKKQPAPAA